MRRGQHENLSFEEFQRSERFAPYAGPLTRSFVLEKFLDASPGNHWKPQIFNGFGFALALKLVDEREGMRTFMKTDSCKMSLDDKLKAAFPHRADLMDLSDLPAVIARMAARIEDHARPAAGSRIA